MNTLRNLLVATAATCLGAGCSRQPPAPVVTAHPVVGGAIHQAVAVLNPTEGHRAQGLVRFTRDGGAVHVSVRVSGLAPGEHGFHVHELGDCSALDASSAGGHFAPFANPHAGRNADRRHVGDLGNLSANASGVAETEFVDSRVTLAGPALSGTASILGRAVVVHSQRDDLVSQPAGDAGARVACGVVGIAASIARDHASQRSDTRSPDSTG
jgi:Cu-Zn family superoxide dismutase